MKTTLKNYFMCWFGGVGSMVVLLTTAFVYAEEPVDDVNPMIGTDKFGHVYPGATLPFGFVQVSPDTKITGWDGCSGYHYSDSNLFGFSFNHLTGTGCPDLGNVLLIPTVGELKLTPGKAPGDGYRARFSHDQEITHPGYYSVFLPDYRVKVELTATTRAGMQRYTFLDATNAHIVLDLWHGIGNVPTKTMVTLENNRTISGYRMSDERGFGGYKVYYFVAEFSRPFKAAGIRLGGKDIEDRQAVGRDIKAHFDYATRAGEQLAVRVALSTVSVEGARRNLRAEMSTWNFDKLVKSARNAWKKTLDNIQIETEDANLKQTFYTAMYHVHTAPIVFSDVDGQFRGPDCQVHTAKGFNYYTELSVWDTFRAEQPLMTLVEPGRVNDIVNTMLTQYKLLAEQMLPLCVYGGKETYCMIGNPSIPVIAEAYRNGFRGWDPNEALAAMVGASERNDEKHDAFAGIGYYRSQGWIPTKVSTNNSSRWQSVSKVLEFGYEDACLARFARSLGREDVAKIYAERSTNWQNVFDASTGFMRGRYTNGDWVTPFDPNRINFHDYTEANAWQYNFFVPHNVPGLIQAMGGDEKFVAKLDELFDTKAVIPNPWADVTGLIGMYAHGNEPCHHVTYLYNYAGQPWKTQARIRQVAKLYDNTPAGLCGNDDCGQMSAWYVFTAIGFYPVDPASGVYVIGSPLVDKATIKLDSKYYKGGTFTMVAKYNSAQNPYIQSASLNGHLLTRSWITHEEIVAGGTLELTMGPVPNRTWGAAQADRPAQPLVP